MMNALEKKIWFHSLTFKISCDFLQISPLFLYYDSEFIYNNNNNKNIFNFFHSKLFIFFLVLCFVYRARTSSFVLPLNIPSKNEKEIVYKKQNRFHSIFELSVNIIPFFILFFTLTNLMKYYSFKPH